MVQRLQDLVLALEGLYVEALLPCLGADPLQRALLARDPVEHAVDDPHASRSQLLLQYVPRGQGACRLHMGRRRTT